MSNSLLSFLARAALCLGTLGAASPTPASAAGAARHAATVHHHEQSRWRSDRPSGGRTSVLGSTAQGCVARGNVITEAEMDAGEHYIVVDSYAGEAQAGAFVLHLEAIGDAWIDRPVAEGVRWRARCASMPRRNVRPARSRCSRRC